MISRRTFLTVAAAATVSPVAAAQPKPAWYVEETNTPRTGLAKDVLTRLDDPSKALEYAYNSLIACRQSETFSPRNENGRVIAVYRIRRAVLSLVSRLWDCGQYSSQYRALTMLFSSTDPWSASLEDLVVESHGIVAVYHAAYRMPHA